MKSKWTLSQQKAIDARGMQVLVSAAAGSGKTSVLTERVKNILSDTENPCSVNEILVVTFTRAAATEMRDRIYGALKETIDIRDNRTDYLRRQMTMLPTADICTIDSFCAKVVKENFAKADVGVDFRVLDDKDIDELTKESLDIVINDLYEENDESFKALTSMFVNERNDNILADVIKTLYKYSRSYPSPFSWLDYICDSFDSVKTPVDTIWSDVIFKYVGMFTDFHYSRLMRCVALMEESGGFSPDYFLRFNSSSEKLGFLRDAVNDCNWDGMVQIIREGLVVKPYARNSKVDERLKELTKNAFDEFEKDVASLNKLSLPLSNEHKSDSFILYPIVKKLCDSVKKLTNILDALKKEKNAYGFDDILHKCIDLLVDFGENEWTKTPLAESLTNRYKEILIDEYQDTNEAQNIIFQALSRDSKNLYVVGDVKQSIYGFRLASPEIFMGLRRNLPEYDGGLHPSQITLDCNFRSRKGIDEAVNYIFSTLMSNSVGEITYDEKETLKFGAEWYNDKATPDTEILCIDCCDMKSGEVVVSEARILADYVKSVIDSGVTVTTKEGVRPIVASDICILLRSMKNKADYYLDALNKKGIPASAITDGDTSESKEIRILISLMKVINNPLVDIPLIAVMLSPLFGFTPDELAEIRMINSKTELYTCLTKYAQSNRKARDFINKLQLYRNVAVSYPVNEFVKFVIDDTLFVDIYSAANGGELRRDNIRGFQKFADDFSNNGRSGLNSFIRYIDNALESGNLKALNTSADSDGVKLMSIHKSKGLEFPYVIIADCSKGFNKRDSYNALTLARDTGIGLKIRDDEKFTKYHSISSAATEKAILFSGASEELRVLYVAMTRAKEHLTFVCSMSGKQLAKRVKMNNILSRNDKGEIHPYAVFKANSYAEWILSCFAKHKDCNIVRDLCDFDIASFDGYSFSVDCSYKEDSVELMLQEPEIVEDAPVDYDLLEKIKVKLSSDYKYRCDGILAKRTASSTEKKQTSKKYFASAKPSFMNDFFTGADRGNAIHKFFELCDFKSAFENVEIEKQRLQNLGFLTEKEYDVIDNNAVDSFFNSDIGIRLLKSDEVYKEYEFSFLKKAGELYENIQTNVYDEDIVVQGKLDCAFIENGKAILIDYKSDSIDDIDSFVSQYKPQIDIYSEALSQCIGCDVVERYLYSFNLRKFIAL